MEKNLFKGFLILLKDLTDKTIAKDYYKILRTCFKGCIHRDKIFLF